MCLVLQQILGIISHCGAKKILSFDRNWVGVLKHILCTSGMSCRFGCGPFAENAICGCCCQVNLAPNVCEHGGEKKPIWLKPFNKTFALGTNLRSFKLLLFQHNANYGGKEPRERKLRYWGWSAHNTRISHAYENTGNGIHINKYKSKEGYCG